ncbi:hypothetical protein BDF19DRAFT_422717 [Syncephalis fuscata]|nr:hypothetical protein BDF19DRAFT_422717 [Syncephalis fuscata]
MTGFIKTGNIPTFIPTQNSQDIESDNRTMRTKWKIFDAQRDRNQCERISSGEIIIPYCSAAIINVELYTGNICLFTVYRLLAFGKFAPNDLLQSIFDARDYGHLLPIDSSDKGHLFWTQPIRNIDITKLYSEKLIAV